MKITQIVVNESIELGDNFDIELGNTVIESRVVGFMNDGVVVEADDKALALLGIGGAVLESVDLNEISTGDYYKKAMQSKGLGAIDTKFGRSPEAQAKGAETVRRREAGLARLDARNEKAKAQADAEYKAALPAKYAEKYAGVDIDAEIARLQKELKSATLDYQYGASNTYSAAKQRAGQIAAQLRDLEQAKKILGQQGVAEGASTNAAQALRDFATIARNRSSLTYYGLEEAGHADKVLDAIKACAAIYNYFKNNNNIVSAIAIDNLRSDLIAFKNGDISTLSQLIKRGSLDKINLQEQGVAEEADDSFTKPAIIMRASPKAMAKAQSILQKQADKNVISMAKIASTVPSQGVAEGSSTTWEVCFDYGPHMSDTVKVKASSEDEAIAKVEKAAEKKGRNIMINWAKPAEQGVAEMDSQKPTGRYKADGTRSHSSYGSRDNYNLGDPEITLGPDSVLKKKDVVKKGVSALNKAFNKKGVAEGAGNIGNSIKALYQKIYRAGDDEIEYFYNDSPIFAQYWDEYEGDLDSIIAEVDPAELQIMLDELESYVEQTGLTEAINSIMDLVTPALQTTKPLDGWVQSIYNFIEDHNMKNDPKWKQAEMFAFNVSMNFLKKNGYPNVDYDTRRQAEKLQHRALVQALAKLFQTEQPVTEGQMKEKMHVDAERMDLAAFVNKYGDEDWIKEFWQAVNNIDEAKYQGRTVPLGKPMQGDVKKFKVYVKNKKGNVVKVNFGDPNMRIKKSNPARRKSFRARHRCATAKDRTSARYWSCRAW